MYEVGERREPHVPAEEANHSGVTSYISESPAACLIDTYVTLISKYLKVNLNLFSNTWSMMSLSILARSPRCVTCR